jgi:hypothetical protein
MKVRNCQIYMTGFPNYSTFCVWPLPNSGSFLWWISPVHLLDKFGPKKKTPKQTNPNRSYYKINNFHCAFVYHFH